jgi:hypothetical protein
VQLEDGPLLVGQLGHSLVQFGPRRQPDGIIWPTA